MQGSIGTMYERLGARILYAADDVSTMVVRAVNTFGKKVQKGAHRPLALCSDLNQNSIQPEIGRENPCTSAKQDDIYIKHASQT